MSLPLRRPPLLLWLAVVGQAACARPEEAAPPPTDSARAPDRAAPATPADTAARPGEGSISGLVSSHPWTAGIVDETNPEARMVTVRALEVETLPDMDRIVLTMEGEELPGYHVEYIDTPLHECGSGRQIHPPGEGWLQLRLSPARGHTEEGEATLTSGRETPELALVRRIDRTCDFEGIVALVLSVDSPEPYHVSVAENPLRLVVDVRHPGAGG